MTLEKQYEIQNPAFFDSLKSQYNLLLITATDVEKDTLHSLIKPIQGRTKIVKISKGNQTYFIGTFGRYGVVHVSCDKMGALSPQGSITTTMDAIQFCEPTVVLMVGIAFGKGGKQKIGDILVSDAIQPYEVQRKGKDTDVSRGTAGQSCRILFNRVKNLTDWNYAIGNRKPVVLPGLLLSGEKLVDNAEYKRQLLEANPTAIGGEMEGYGVYTACTNRSIPHWIVVKSICDWGDGNKSRGKARKQKIAAETSVNFCHHLFDAIHGFEDVKLVPIITSDPEPPPVSPVLAAEDNAIIEEMKEELKSETSGEAASIEAVVRAFYLLDDYEKIDIAKGLRLFSDNSTIQYHKVTEKEIFSKAKEMNLLPELWEEIHKISPFANLRNPFIKHPTKTKIK